MGFSLKAFIKSPFTVAKKSITNPTDFGGITKAAAGIEEDKPKTPAAPKVFAMPDQEEQKRIGRRNAAKRRGGRTSTILTGQDTLG